MEQQAAATVSTDDRRRAAAQAALARLQSAPVSSADVNTNVARSPSAAPSAPVAAQPAPAGSARPQSASKPTDAARVDPAAKGFNRHLVGIVDYKHNHPQHVLAAVKLISRVVADLQRCNGRSPNDASQPVRSTSHSRTRTNCTHSLGLGIASCSAVLGCGERSMLSAAPSMR